MLEFCESLPLIELGALQPRAFLSISGVAQPLHPSHLGCNSVFSLEGKQSELENSIKMMIGNTCSEIGQFFRGPMFEAISINTCPFFL